MNNFLKPTPFKVLLTIIIIFTVMLGPFLHSRSVEPGFNELPIEQEVNIGVKSLYIISNTFLFPVRLISEPVNSWLFSYITEEEKNTAPQNFATYSTILFLIFFLIPLIIQSYLVSGLVDLGLKKIKRED